MEIIRSILHMACIIFSFRSTNSWTYHNQDEWKQEFQTCGLKNQSPISINTKEAIALELFPLIFQNYNNPYGGTLSNNGHSIQLVLHTDADNRPAIIGGLFHPYDRYELQSLHFHWGPNDTVGSEHVINGYPNSMELHMVHRNSKYKSMEEAIGQPDGFSVISRFVDARDYYQEFEALNPIVTSLPYIRKFKSQMEIPIFSLRDFIDDIRENENQLYYTYRGSLTTPPCSDNVNWFIFPKPLRVSSSQLTEIRSLLDDHNHRLDYNFRNLQDLGELTTVYVRKI
ncbi:carbonic anhydrase 7-like [Haematobia irritans]|uniref:carbonic anhydrase 7-like n=1 Tax=Haematobia irritans TaxID=7368 RepID=UPI003F4FD3B2